MAKINEIMTLLEETAQRASASPKDFDLATFSKKTFGMFSGTDERIILKCGSELVGVIIDRFGKGRYDHASG